MKRTFDSYCEKFFGKSAKNLCMHFDVQPFLCFSDLLLNRLKQETPYKDKEVTHAQRHKIWGYKMDGSNDNVFLSYFIKQTTDYRYFYRQVQNIEKGKISHGKINLALFIEACLFLGIQYPDHIPLDHLPAHHPLRGKILYQVFLMAHMPDYWPSVQSQYQVFDQNGLWGNGVEGGNETDESFGESQVIKTIESYFDAVSARDYNRAWSLLDDNMKQRIWKGSFDHFVDGYFNTLKISQIHIWDIRKSARNYSCKVFYMDKISINYSRDQTDLSKLTIGEIDRFSGIVKDILEQSENANITRLHALEISKLQEKTFSEYARFKTKASKDQIEYLFPFQQTDSIARLYEVVCLQNGLDLKINGIIPIKGINLR